jgi:23S rRNA (uridine2479-2'-O)-methyltransferase
MATIRLLKETNEIQRVVALQQNRNKRHRYREFVIEGRVAIEEAYKRGWKIRSLFYSKEQPLSPWAQQHLDQGVHQTAYALSDQLIGRISDKTDSSELIAIVEQSPRSFASYQPTSGDVIVVLDEPKSPGNTGMMIRSAAAFGVSALIISGHGTDEYDPQSIRASRGTFFSLPIYRVEGIRLFSKKIETLRQKSDVAVIASGNRGFVSLEKASFQADILFFVLGNETDGISVGYRQLADQFVQIPLEREFTSLNIAAAGSIFLYEIFRQRKEAL